MCNFYKVLQNLRRVDKTHIIFLWIPSWESLCSLVERLSWDALPPSRPPHRLQDTMAFNSPRKGFIDCVLTYLQSILIFVFNHSYDGCFLLNSGVIKSCCGSVLTDDSRNMRDTLQVKSLKATGMNSPREIIK